MNLLLRNCHMQHMQGESKLCVWVSDIFLTETNIFTNFFNVVDNTFVNKHM